MKENGAVADGLPRLPFARPDVVALAPEYAILGSRAPLTKVITRAGDPAWLVTRYHEAKQLFADDRLGRSHPDPANAPRIADSLMFGGPMGDHATERQLHSLQRKLLVPTFSARRMRKLADHVDGLVDQMLDRMAGLQPPIDLHDNLSFPLPIVMICELLGVPVTDQDKIREWSWRFAGLVDIQDAMAAGMAMTGYMNELVEAKRRQPGDDFLSDLIGAAEGTDLLPDAQIAEMGVSLLFGGHETTVARIDYGTLLLLLHHEQRAALVADRTLVEPAVEEIMRFSVPVDDHFPRYAHADVEIAGIIIRAGEAVLISPGIANRDPLVFPDPDRFDIFRESSEPHLGFGHGMHFCVGAALARLELRTVFGKLFQRFPNMELAIPFEELHLNLDRFTGGLRELPVTW